MRCVMLFSRTLAGWSFVVPMVLLSGCFFGKDESSPSAFLEAVVQGNEVEVLSLIRKGANVNEAWLPKGAAGSTEKITPLMMAVATGNAKMTQILILNGAEQHPTVMGYSAFDLALDLDDESMLKLFQREREASR